MQELVSLREAGTGPSLILSDDCGHFQPLGHEVRRFVAIIDLCEQGAVIKLVDDYERAIALHHVSRFSKQLSWECAKEIPLIVVHIEVGACDFLRAARKAHFVAQLADAGAVVCGFFSQPEPGAGYVPINDDLLARDAIWDPGQKELAFAFDIRVFE